MAVDVLNLSPEIRSKLKKTFHVSYDDIDAMLCFFRDKLKPEIKNRYLSHLVSTIEDMINNQEKARILEDVAKAKELEEGQETQNAFKYLEEAINSKHYRLFVITLIPTIKTKKNATTRIVRNNAMIYYNSRLEEKDKRLLIAHELGHIIEQFVFKQNGSEGIASLFAYIAMLDKNKFYREECKDFLFPSDLTIFEELKRVLHYSDN